MVRIVRVKGQELRFPDSMTDEQIDAIVKRDFFGGGSPAPAPPQEDTAAVQARLRAENIAKGFLPGEAMDRFIDPATGMRKELSTGQQIASDIGDVVGGGVRGLASLAALGVDAATLGPRMALAGMQGERASLLPATQATNEAIDSGIDSVKGAVGIDPAALEMQEGRSQALRLGGEVALDPALVAKGVRAIGKAGAKGLADEAAPALPADIDEELAALEQQLAARPPGSEAAPPRSLRDFDKRAADSADAKVRKIMGNPDVQGVGRPAPTLPSDPARLAARRAELDQLMLSQDPQHSARFYDYKNEWDAINAKLGDGPAPDAPAIRSTPVPLKERVKDVPYEFTGTTSEPAAVNTKTWYHGTGADGLTPEALTPLQTKAEGLFGMGVYLTDNPRVAAGYAANRGKRAGKEVIYEANVNVGRVLDMEAPAPPEARRYIRETLESTAGQAYEDSLPKFDALANNPTTTTEELWEFMTREISEYSKEMGIPSYEFDENLSFLAENLKRDGWDALTHTGGKRVGKEKHAVLILLDPNDTYAAGRAGQVSRFQPWEPPARPAVSAAPPDLSGFGPAPEPIAMNAGVVAGTPDPAEARRYLASNPDTPRDARGQLFREGLSDEQRAALEGPSAKAEIEPGVQKVLDEVQTADAGRPPSNDSFLARKAGDLLSTNSDVMNYGVLSMSDALTNSGPVGRRAADVLKRITATADQMAVRPVEDLGQMRKWGEAENNAFIDILEGRLSKNDPSVPPEIRAAADAHQAHLARFAAEAKAAGIQIELPDGSKVDFSERANYFPHYFEKGKQRFGRPRPSQPGTVSGNITKARSADGEDFIRDAPAVLSDYYTRVARQIAEAKALGNNVDKAVQNFANAAEVAGENPQLINDLFGGALGRQAAMAEAERGIAGVATNLQVATKLPTAVIANATQPGFTFADAGFNATAKAYRDVAKKVFGKGDPDTFRTAIDTGATLESIVRSVTTSDPSNKSAKLAQWVLRNTGFSFIEKWNRIISAQAGIYRARELAPKALAGDQNAIGQLYELGVNIDEFKKTGKLSEQDVLDAGFNMSHRTQFGGRREDLPYLWTANPAMKVILQFKGFGHKAAGFVAKQLVKPALNGDFAPLLRFAAAAGVLGTAQRQVNEWTKGEGMLPLEIKTFVEGMASLGMANIVAEMIRNATGDWQGRWSEFIGGPTFGTLNDAQPMIREYATDPIDSLEDDLSLEGPASKFVQEQVPLARRIGSFVDNVF